MASMQFCRSCNNMLYPREDRAAKKLMYKCHRCDYEQEAEQPFVYKHELIKGAANQLEVIPREIIEDSALQREQQAKCPKCSGSGAMFILAKAAPSDDRLQLIFICTNPECVHKWAA